MDIREYYRKLREVEASIDARVVEVVSLRTSDGGRAGVRTAVSREIAAKLIVENRARLASVEEIEDLRTPAPPAAELCARGDEQQPEKP